MSEIILSKNTFTFLSNKLKDENWLELAKKLSIDIRHLDTLYTKGINNMKWPDIVKLILNYKPNNIFTGRDIGDRCADCDVLSLEFHKSGCAHITIKQNTQFNTGAQRGPVNNIQITEDLAVSKSNYVLVLQNEPALRRIAETFQEGNLKYNKNDFVENYKKGIPVSNLIEHVFLHIKNYLKGDDSEDHLAHAVWGLMSIMFMEEEKPEMVDLPQRQGKTYTPWWEIESVLEQIKTWQSNLS